MPVASNIIVNIMKCQTTQTSVETIPKYKMFNQLYHQLTYYAVLANILWSIYHSQIQNVEPLYITRRSILQYLLITSMGMDFIPMLVTTSMGMKSIPMLVVKIYSISWMEYWKIFWFTFWIWECYSHIADFEYRQIPLVVKVITCVVLGLSLVAFGHSW